MASNVAGKKQQYEGHQLLDEFLLNQVAKEVNVLKLCLFAKDLGVPETEYQKITAPNTFTKDEQIHHILNEWFQDRPLTYSVEEFLHEVKKWQGERFVNRHIWIRLQEHVGLELLKTIESTQNTELPQASSQSSIASLTEVQPSFFHKHGENVLLSSAATGSWIVTTAAAIPIPSMTFTTSAGKTAATESSAKRTNSVTRTNYVIPSEEEIAELQELTRKSLNLAWKNYLSNDWLPPDKAYNFSVDKFYVDLKWIKMVKEALKTVKKDLTSIFDVVMAAGDGGTNILVQAHPGMGKTASVAMLAVKYATKSEEMKDFDFVFTIRLKYVDKESSLPELIVQQHEKLKPHHVGQIRAILEGKTKHKVALLLDGYDEYKRSTNIEIDKAIESGIGGCFLMLTSRPGFVEKATRDRMDGVVRIEGFNYENIKRCCDLYLGSRKQTDKLLRLAKQSGISDDKLLRIPIILLMICVIFDENQTLPKTRTDIVKTIIELMMDRSTLKHFACKSSELKYLDNLLKNLGKLSWDALQKDTGQLLLQKEQVDAASKDIMKLGLLSMSGSDAMTIKEVPTHVSFGHKLLQEWVGAYFIEKGLQKEPLDSFFPSWDVIERQQEVVKFLCGLMSDPTSLVDHVYQLWIDKQLKHVRNKGVLPREMREEELFRSLYRESRVEFPGHPLHNHHINYYNHMSVTNHDVAPIYKQSKFYWFRYIKEDITLEYQVENNEMPGSVIWIENPRTAVTKRLLSTCLRISQLQPVTDLCMSSVRCKDWPEPNRFNMSKKVLSVTLYDCTWPFLTLKHLIDAISDFEQLEIYKIGHRKNSSDIGRFHVKSSAVESANVSRSHTVNPSQIQIKNCRLPSQSLIHLIQQSGWLKELDLSMVDVESYEEGTISASRMSFGLMLINRTLIEFRECNLPPETLNHIICQINAINTTHKMIFLGTKLQDVSSFTLSNKTSLTHLELSQTHLSPEMWVRICQQINCLTSLKYIDLSENNLSQVSFLTLWNKKSLKHLDLKDTEMSTDQNERVCQESVCLETLENIYLAGLSIDRDVYSVQHVNLPTKIFGGELFKQMINRFSFRRIDIKDTVPGRSLATFLPDLKSGFAYLKDLKLRETGLNHNDLQYFSMLTQSNKLPKLRYLDLSGNTLTGRLSGFLPNPHPGLPELKTLWLDRSALNQDDLQHITHLIQTRKLPGLEQLNLEHNRLGEMETDVEHLIEACVKHHKRNLTLYFNDLSWDCKDKWVQRCKGTNILVIL